LTSTGRRIRFSVSETSAVLEIPYVKIIPYPFAVILDLGELLTQFASRGDRLKEFAVGFQCGHKKSPPPILLTGAILLIESFGLVSDPKLLAISRK
jgi:hypothetical protein